MSITVKRPEPHNTPALKRIWQTCFEDTTEYVDTFFENGFHAENALVALYESKPVGMMYTLPSLLKVNGKEYLGEYIYAAAVLPEYRNKGILRKMEEEATALAAKNQISFLTLIPQHDGLFKMYEKMGYRTAFYNSIRSYMPFKTTQTLGCSIRPCDAITFKELRGKFLSTKPYYIDFLPPYDDYRFIETQTVGANLMLAVVDAVKYYFIGFRRGSVYLIKETNLTESALKRILPLVATEYKVDIVSVRGSGGGVVDSITPYAMYKCIDGAVDINAIKSNRAYINLMLD